MTSIGYFSPVGSASPATNPNNPHANLSGHGKLGGGIKGFIPQAMYNTNNTYEITDTRFLLTQAWNTKYPKINGKHQVVQTPFRAVNNAGDLLSRKYYSCGGPCQTFQSRPRLHGLKGRFGSIQSVCDGTGVEPAACNPKFVYDNSDYVRYLKQNAIHKNYNNISNNGNLHSGSQSAIRAIRRF